MLYDVKIIEEGLLPSGHDWVLVECDGHMTLCVKSSACGPRVLAEAWAAYRKLDRHHTPCRERLLRPA